MKYEDIKKANETINTTNIKGKEYAEVNQRIKAFRMIYPTGKVETALVSCENGICIFKAIVATNEGNILGTGTAYEKENSSFINKTSYIENCETSAVGRALGMAGFGIDTSVASAEDIENVIAGENGQIDRDVENEYQVSDRVTEVESKTVYCLMMKKGLDVMKELKRNYGVTNTKELTKEQYASILKTISNLPDRE